MMPYDEALTELAKVSNPIETIISSSAYWVPLQWLYVKIAENKEITPLSELPKQEKERYWRMVVNLEKPKWVKISIAQSLYIYEFVK
jgi:hypothetical protein